MILVDAYGRKYGRKFLAAVAFVTLEAVCDLLQPAIMSRIIDVGVAGKNLTYILHMGSAMLGITALGAVVASARNIISSRVSQRLGADLRLELYEKIHSLSFSTINQLDRSSGTIMDNIRWGKEEASVAEIEAAAVFAQAHEFISRLPEGYQTQLGQGGVSLSGGQKQRVSLARALVRKPEILILDDCTSAVDGETEGKINQAIRQYARQAACFLVGQRITSVMAADKILVMDDGQIVGAGTHEELLQTCQVYQEIFQSQMGKGLNRHAVRK